MNHLMRELAPVTDEAWAQIEAEATRSIKHVLAGRRLVDFSGPHGLGAWRVDVGRADQVDSGGLDGVEAAQRSVLPSSSSGPPSPSPIPSWPPPIGAPPTSISAAVIAAGRAAALAEDHLVFHGYRPGGISGIVAASPHEAVTISDDYSHYPEHVAKAVGVLRAADIAGPFAIALGARCYTGVTETTEHGGYPGLRAPAPDPRRPGGVGTGGGRRGGAQPTRRGLRADRG